MVREIGSDFEMYEGENPPECRLFTQATLLASGRQAIYNAVMMASAKRLWIPAYFCYEVIDTLRSYGLEIAYYDDHPLAKVGESPVLMQLNPDEALLQVNYFGLRASNVRPNTVAVVIEDQTHNLTASGGGDVKVASLRKSLPVALGGAIFTSSQNTLTLSRSTETESLANRRYSYMRLKSMYLRGKISNKDTFRSGFVESEGEVALLPISQIDSTSKKLINDFDVYSLFSKKLQNWSYVNRRLGKRLDIMQPEDNSCIPFSVVALTADKSERDALRKYLISQSIYPAVLWVMPPRQEDIYPEAFDLSERLLSLHCDYRYDLGDMERLCKVIEEFYGYH